MKTAIVGTKFRPGGMAALSKLRKGAGLLIVRESGNQHDPNAVAVLSDEAIIDRGDIKFAPKIAISRRA